MLLKINKNLILAILFCITNGCQNAGKINLLMQKIKNRQKLAWFGIDAARKTITHWHRESNTNLILPYDIVALCLQFMIYTKKQKDRICSLYTIKTNYFSIYPGKSIIKQLLNSSIYPIEFICSFENREYRVSNRLRGNKYIKIKKIGFINEEFITIKEEIENLLNYEKLRELIVPKTERLELDYGTLYNQDLCTTIYQFKPSCFKLPHPFKINALFVKTKNPPKFYCEKESSIYSNDRVPKKLYFDSINFIKTHSIPNNTLSFPEVYNKLIPIHKRLIIECETQNNIYNEMPHSKSMAALLDCKNNLPPHILNETSIDDVQYQMTFDGEKIAYKTYHFPDQPPKDFITFSKLLEIYMEPKNRAHIVYQEFCLKRGYKGPSVEQWKQLLNSTSLKNLNQAKCKFPSRFIKKNIHDQRKTKKKHYLIPYFDGENCRMFITTDKMEALNKFPNYPKFSDVYKYYVTDKEQLTFYQNREAKREVEINSSNESSYDDFDSSYEDSFGSDLLQQYRPDDKCCVIL